MIVVSRAFRNPSEINEIYNLSDFLKYISSGKILIFFAYIT